MPLMLEPDQGAQSADASLLSSLFSSKDAVFLFYFDPAAPHFRMINANAAAVKLMDCCVAQLCIFYQDKFLHTVDPGRTNYILCRLPTKKQVRFETCLYTGNERTLLTEITALSFCYNEQGALLIICRPKQSYAPPAHPVSVKKAEQKRLSSRDLIRALLEQQDLYRALINAMPTLVCLKDGEGRWLEANQFTLELFHLKGKPYRGKTDRELTVISPLHHSAFELCSKSDQLAWEASRVVHTEETFLTLDHTEKIFEIIKIPLYYLSGTRKGILILGHDITSRKQTEAKLRFSESRSRTLVEQASDGIFLTGLHGQFFDVNKRACAMLGYGREELLGMRLQQIVLAEERNRLPDDLGRIACGTSEINEYTFVGKQGQTIPVEVNTTRLSDRSLLTIARDISERRKSQEIQKQLELDAARIDRLHLVGEMAVSLGHEIRNPMTTVRGYLQLMLNREDLVRYSSWIKLMLADLDKANATITRFLSLAKNKSLDLVPNNLNTIISNMVSEFSLRAAKEFKQIQLELAPLPQLLLDANEISQLISNLVNNALDATPIGDTLHIATYTEKRHVVLSVQDEGPGIPERLQKKLGIPFVTTKDDALGLGLAVCYHVALRHNAVIKISTGQSGTLVSVYFKLSD